MNRLKTIANIQLKDATATKFLNGGTDSLGHYYKVKGGGIGENFMVKGIFKTWFNF